MATEDIPTKIIAEIFKEWKKEYGVTYPLYGKETIRHDISGSVRPLLASTEIPHERILSERSGVSKRILTRILNQEIPFIAYELADRLLTAMDRADVWYVELNEYR